MQWMQRNRARIKLYTFRQIQSNEALSGAFSGYWMRTLLCQELFGDGFKRLLKMLKTYGHQLNSVH